MSDISWIEASIKKNPPRYLSLADATKRLDPTRLDGPSFFQSIVSLHRSEDVYCVRELENLESCSRQMHVSVLDSDRSIRRSRPRSKKRSCSHKEITRCSTNVRPACGWYMVIGIWWLVYAGIIAAKFDAQQRMAKNGAHRTFDTNVVAFKLKT